MNLRLALVLALVSLLCSACVTGTNYPDSYASAYCGTIYACFETDSIEDFFGWDSVSDCRDEKSAEGTESWAYDAYLEGDRVFDSEAAGNCIGEVEEFRSDPDCAGEELNLFNGAGFLLDIEHEDCAAVYPEAE